jgi:methionine-rich copper-binding protein CopC
VNASIQRAAILAALLLLVVVPSALAHAELVRARPADGATVDEGPIEIVATFNEALDNRSSIQLRNAANEIVARGAVDGRTLRIGLEGLLPGEYEVRWTAIGSDGHPERSDPGSWRFTVAQAASPSPSPVESESPSPTESSPTSRAPSVSPSVEPSPEPSPSPEPGSTAGGGDAILPIIVVLAIVLAGLAALLLRGRRAA